MSEPLDLIDIGRELRKACEEAGGQKAWAEKHGLSSQHVNDAVNSRGGRPPSAKILAALRYRPVTRYVKIRS